MSCVTTQPDTQCQQFWVLRLYSQTVFILPFPVLWPLLPGEVSISPSSALQFQSQVHPSSSSLLASCWTTSVSFLPSSFVPRNSIKLNHGLPTLCLHAYFHVLNTVFTNLFPFTWISLLDSSKSKRMWEMARTLGNAFSSHFLEEIVTETGVTIKWRMRTQGGQCLPRGQ